MSSLIGEPIRPVDQEGWLPLTIRKWGFLLSVKPGLSTRPALKPLFEQRDYCSGPLTVNSSRLESFLPSPVQMAPPGTVLGHGQDDGHITVGVRVPP